MSQIIAPFYIPPKGVNPMGIARIRPQQGMSKGEIKLVVLTGGPVFLFEAEVGAQEAYDRTHGFNGRDVDFDLGASLTVITETLTEAFPSMMTVASDAETVGFVQFRECKTR